MNRLDTVRDVLILRDGDTCLVTAVDSCGGIGEKPMDSLSTPPEVVGLFTARTALLEVLAAGARPAFITVSACNEPGTAERLLCGVLQAAEPIGTIPWAMSTEKNMVTAMTALGVTVTGSCKISDLRIGKCKAADWLCCAGLPLVGREILAPGAEVFDLAGMDALLACLWVGSIIPVGSRGIAAEAGVLAHESGLAIQLDHGCGVDFDKSAGPSSCVLFSTSRPDCGLGFPYTAIGRFACP